MTLRTAHAVYPIAFDNTQTGYTPTPNDVRNSLAAQQGTGDAIVNDPMLKRSTDSVAMLEYWDLTDTIVDGINALRLAGTTYLPKFIGELQTDYAYRLKCTKMTNIYRDAVEALASKPFEEEVSIKTDEDKPVPQEIQDFIENVDGSNNNLTVFAGATFFNGINSAIDWIFVDHSKPDPNIKSVADQKAAGLRPDRKSVV